MDKTQCRQQGLLTRISIFAVAALIMSGCVKAEAPAPSEPLFAACLVGPNQDTEQALALELALTADERSRGLMFREDLPDQQGMLFVYPEPRQLSFWMYNTRIPLDIAYMNDRFEILEILSMEPCPHTIAALCPSYPSSQSGSVALEVNQGQFAKWGVSVGHRLYNEDCESPLEVSHLFSSRNGSPKNDVSGTSQHRN
ncbi:DUF192 domain-containing protein [Aliidiomarina indica]|uniref:DUF192 domain-containing protein n=1 Tax=Aliidiomarina indica TaxID=2749147 RepID=UPI00188E73AC|nr:DUF192 domain-containing protein [Aliidiomarina indica]